MKTRTYILESGLIWVILGFAVMIAVNLATLAAGPSGILASLNSQPWGVVASVFVFDSWGTAGGLAGVAILFTPVLFGVPRSQRRWASAFFLGASLGCGILANVIWSDFYNQNGLIGSGSSSIDIAAQGVLFTLSIFGLAGLTLGRRERTNASGEAGEWRQFFLVVYLTIIISTLYFVILVESIFVPTELYNWRVHEFSFFMAVAATAVYSSLASRRPPLDQDSGRRANLNSSGFSFLQEGWKKKATPIRA